MSRPNEQPEINCHEVRQAIEAWMDGDGSRGKESRGNDVDGSGAKRQAGMGVWYMVRSFYCCATPKPDGGLEQHLADCHPCREHRDNLLSVRQAVRTLPLLPLPDDALEAVFGRTVNDVAAGPSARFPGRRWVRFATAAAIVMGVIVPWFVLNRRNADVRAARADRAVAETRYVLNVVTGALNRAERVAVNEVLGGRVAEAVHRVSIDWSKFPLPIVRRSGT